MHSHKKHNDKLKNIYIYDLYLENEKSQLEEIKEDK